LRIDILQWRENIVKGADLSSFPMSNTYMDLALFVVSAKVIRLFYVYFALRLSSAHVRYNCNTKPKRAGNSIIA